VKTRNLKDTFEPWVYISCSQITATSIQHSFLNWMSFLSLHQGTNWTNIVKALKDGRYAQHRAQRLCWYSAERKSSHLCWSDRSNYYIAHKQCYRDMITRVIHFNNRTVALLLMTYTDIWWSFELLRAFWVWCLVAWASSVVLACKQNAYTD